MTAVQLVPILVFIAVLLIVTAGYLAASAQRTRRKTVSRRLTDFGPAQANQGELMRIRRGRSLSTDGHYALPFIPLNQLILQSGVTVGIQGILFSMLFLFAGVYFVLAMLKAGAVIAVAGGIVAGLGFPVVVLRSMRASRQRRFEEQLPDAIDILVRGLKAGHAIPVALATVGRQMAEPLGGEFSITAGELTYGLDLETAMVNLRSRVGQADLSLIVLAVSIQAKMGGNLAEILSNLSRVIRDRFKLRRKAKALSAEGRYSAIFLSVMPIALFGVLAIISPSYYGQIWNEAIVKPVLGGAVAWMMFGNYIMYRMVKFNI
ncbi:MULTISPECIES: type II secretion system F family protein [Rhodomicrobium]|uniref:type II secretion system F family protein n=1 Tax=Rhodomicrobium TaxID=1068 RepID=UPI000B4B869C|nr:MULTISPECIES: type II secretion system F family protein [Rhodomicrobium]